MHTYDRQAIYYFATIDDKGNNRTFIDNDSDIYTLLDTYVRRQKSELIRYRDCENLSKSIQYRCNLLDLDITAKNVLAHVQHSRIIRDLINHFESVCDLPKGYLDPCDLTNTKQYSLETYKKRLFALENQIDGCLSNLCKVLIKSNNE